MNCYKCSSKMNKKSFESVLVDFCPTCEGIWLDGGELDMIRTKDTKSKEEILAEAKNELLIEKRTPVSTQGLCPKCQESSLTEELMSGVKVDVCTHCEGIHFDWGELQQVLNSKTPSTVVDFIKNLARHIKFK